MDEQRITLECTLSTDELLDRRAAWSDLAATLVDRAWTDKGFRLGFRREAGVPESLRALVVAERNCCGWASWTLTDEGDCSVLEVTGPAEKIATLAAAFGL